MPERDLKCVRLCNCEEDGCTFWYYEAFEDKDGKTVLLTSQTFNSKISATYARSCGSLKWDEA